MSKPKIKFCVGYQVRGSSRREGEMVLLRLDGMEKLPRNPQDLQNLRGAETHTFCSNESLCGGNW